jgi:hypothetical protein
LNAATGGKAKGETSMFYVNAHSSRGTLDMNAERQAFGVDEQMPYEPAVVGTLSYREVDDDIFAA